MLAEDSVVDSAAAAVVVVEAALIPTDTVSRILRVYLHNIDYDYFTL